MDLERLYRLAKFHMVRAAVCIALKRAGVQDKQFDQAYKKAVRKNIYLDMERSAILSDFEQQGIWYMPLKDRSKLSLWVHSIFIPHKQMAASVPFTAKSSLLYPVGVVLKHHITGKDRKCGPCLM